MTETTLQWIEFTKLLVVAGFALLYGLGGIYGKWRRRFIAPALVVIAISGFAYAQGAFSWWLLGWYPLLVGSLTLGYGADKTSKKILLRTLTGLAVAIAAIPIAIVTQQWLLFGLHIGINVAFRVILGVWNPISARGEETLIGAVSVLLPFFMLG